MGTRRHTTVQENELSAGEGFPKLFQEAALSTTSAQRPCQQDATDPPPPCSHPESIAMLSLFPWSRILLPTPAAGVPGTQDTMYFKELVCGKDKTSTLTATKRPYSLLAVWLPFCPPV